MWLALKLLASGAFKGALRGLSAAADWRAPLILFAAGFAVMAFIRVPALQREIDRARADLAAEQAAHLGTVNAFLAASVQAQKDAEANVQRVAREQEIITDEVTRHLRGDLAAVTVRFDRLRAQYAAQVDPRRADAAGLPSTGNAAGRVAGAPGDHDLRAPGHLNAQPGCPIGLVCLTIDQAERASQDAVRHDRLIDWVLGQSAVRFASPASGEVPRDE